MVVEVGCTWVVYCRRSSQRRLSAQRQLSPGRGGQSIWDYLRGRRRWRPLQEPVRWGLWTETDLYDFGGVVGDGTVPEGPLTIDGSGNLYGTTSSGGFNGAGTVFELSPPKTAGGAWTESTLYNFCSASNHTDGAYPVANLLLIGVSRLRSQCDFVGEPHWWRQRNRHRGCLRRSIRSERPAALFQSIRPPENEH